MQPTPTYQIAVLPGDGIGPEVTDEAVRVLEAAASAHGFSLDVETYPIGGIAIDQYGEPLPATTLAACREADAVLLGAVGGPAWDNETGQRRPESGLLKLRKSLGVYANLRPVTVPASLADASPLRTERVAGTDVLIVRELTGGIYFGEPRGVTLTEYMNYSVSDTAEYGNYSRGPRVIGESVKQEMKKILGEIQSGAFAKEWIAECDAGAERFEELRAQSKQHPIEKVGKKLRKMMSWLRPKKEADTAQSPVAV